MVSEEVFFWALAIFLEGVGLDSWEGSADEKVSLYLSSVPHCFSEAYSTFLGTAGFLVFSLESYFKAIFLTTYLRGSLLTTSFIEESLIGFGLAVLDSLLVSIFGYSSFEIFSFGISLSGSSFGDSFIGSSLGATLMDTSFEDSSID